MPTLLGLRTLLAATPSALRPQLQYRIRQAMTPAVYDERQGSHFSLGFHAYIYFTSPIRRYVWRRRRSAYGAAIWMRGGSHLD